VGKKVASGRAGAHLVGGPMQENIPAAWRDLQALYVEVDSRLGTHGLGNDW
jgi:hypothetical protein